MKRVLFLILIIFLTSDMCEAKHQFKEQVYQAYWCEKNNGLMEYRLNDGTRVDCLTDTLAVEVDFAPKWAECIGQCKHYSHKTGKQPACVLIMENWEKDQKYLKRLRYNAYKPDMRFKTFTITPDKINRLTIQEITEE